MMAAVLRCQGLSVCYGKRQVLRAVGLSLAEGVFALQGANGVGKSTLLRVLAGAQAAEAGEVWIDGLSMARTPEAARRRLSYVPDESPVYPFMTGSEFLRFVARTRRTGLDDGLPELIGDFELAPQLQVRFDAMSLGTQKKMLLCAAWIGAPRVILMDEPSNGLDSRARDRLAAQIRSWSERATMLFSTHDPDMIAATGASILMMDELLDGGHGTVAVR